VLLMGVYQIAIIAFLWAFSFSACLLYMHIKLAWRKKILAEDAHKIKKTLVANLGGIVLFLIPLLALPLLLFADVLGSEAMNVYLALISSTLIGLVIGLIDDIKDLGLLKAGLVALAGIPIILLHVYLPRPYIPMVGRTRMTLLYPLVILAFFSVFADACNMIDIFNGVLAGQVIFVLVPLLILSLLFGGGVSTILIMIGLGYTLAFLLWNRYPAKVFHGNVGAYGLGAMLSAIIILSAIEVRGVEFVAIIAFLPAIYNGFIYVFNTRFAPRRKLSRSKKAVFFRDGYLEPNRDITAALNLTRLLTLKGRLTEKQLIIIYYLMFICSSFLATLTAVLMFLGVI